MFLDRNMSKYLHEFIKFIVSFSCFWGSESKLMGGGVYWKSQSCDSSCFLKGFKASNLFWYSEVLQEEREAV